MSETKTKITIRNNGPVRIEGENFEVCDANGVCFNLNGRTAISICRCGNSKQQPFCDGAHKECKFESTVAAYDLPPKA